jgi:hypothetical protein
MTEAELKERCARLDDELAYEMQNMPRQASADLIPWASRVIRLKAQWDALRTLMGERVRT